MFLFLIWWILVNLFDDVSLVIIHLYWYFCFRWYVSIDVVLAALSKYWSIGYLNYNISFSILKTMKVPKMETCKRLYLVCQDTQKRLLSCSSELQGLFANVRIASTNFHVSSEWFVSGVSLNSFQQRSQKCTWQLFLIWQCSRRLELRWQHQINGVFMMMIWSCYEEKPANDWDIMSFADVAVSFASLLALYFVYILMDDVREKIKNKK